MSATAQENMQEKMLRIAIRSAVSILPKGAIVETSMDPDDPEVVAIAAKCRADGKTLRLIQLGDLTMFAFVPADFPSFTSA